MGLSHREKNSSVYEVNAYWIGGSNGRTLSLNFGTIKLIFNNDFSHELDGLQSYHGLNFSKALCLSGKFKDPKTNVRGKRILTNSHMAFGNGRAWSENHRNVKDSDEEFRVLVDCWFDLPNVPEGAVEWMSLVNRS